MKSARAAGIATAILPRVEKFALLNIVPMTELSAFRLTSPDVKARGGYQYKGLDTCQRGADQQGAVLFRLGSEWLAFQDTLG